MKAVTPVHPGEDSSISLHLLSQHSMTISRCRMEEEDQSDMKHCYSRLRRLVPTIPQDKRVSRVEILQHVIDYIWDLQLQLETHPALLKQTGTSGSNRTPLTVLNTDHQRTSIGKKDESILCR
ncbi:hypothetical protein DPEC_G00053100 [Dallia pectoralis]|uniref:Uncharacterized protein n=1 Tax=Dallia pectoralis TaxID=75939 RepID=A0ACC2HCE7_DALPE|nr:hypothetical protein DPEC_G00053100 [Dallia pectoralis]